VRKLVYTIITTLDGYIDNDDYEPTDDEHAFANRQIDESGAIVFGRVMHGMLVPFWDTFDVNDTSVPAVHREFAKFFQMKPRYVVSRTLDKVEDNATLISDNVVESIAALKEQPGDRLALACGPRLLATLVGNNLVDEIQILVRPFIRGGGKPVFRDIDNPQHLTLLETRAFASGAVLLRYAAA